MYGRSSWENGRRPVQVVATSCVASAGIHSSAAAAFRRSASALSSVSAQGGRAGGADHDRAVGVLVRGEGVGRLGAGRRQVGGGQIGDRHRRARLRPTRRRVARLVDHVADQRRAGCGDGQPAAHGPDLDVVRRARGRASASRRRRTAGSSPPPASLRRSPRRPRVTRFTSTWVRTSRRRCGGRRRGRSQRARVVRNPSGRAGPGDVGGKRRLLAQHLVAIPSSTPPSGFAPKLRSCSSVVASIRRADRLVSSAKSMSVSTASRGRGGSSRRTRAAARRGRAEQQALAAGGRPGGQRPR